MRRFACGLVLVAVGAATGCNDPGSPAVVLAQGQQGVTAIAVDGAYVYWSTVDAVKRVSIDGGKPEIVFDQGKIGNDPHLAVDRESVYWTNAGAVFAVPKGGGAMAILAGTTEPLSDLTGFAVEDESAWVYFTEDAGAVRRAPKVPGELVTLAVGESHPASPVARGASLYWRAAAAENMGAVRAMDLGGSSAMSLSPSVTGLAQIAVDASNVYWATNPSTINLPTPTTSASGSTVNWLSLGGGDVTEIAAGKGEVAAIVGDTGNVYWSSLAGTVNFAPTYPGATAATLVSGPQGLVSIATDLTSIYWANSVDGAVMTMPKF